MTALRSGLNTYRACARAASVACAFFLVLLAGCSDDLVPLRPLASDTTIVAFGDSLTFGTGAKRDQSYPAVLSELIQRRVVTSGVPGELSKDGLKRLPGVLEEHQPGLVILCHGGNDLLRKRSIAAATANLRNMVQLARDAGAQVVLLGVPSPALILSTAEHYDTVAEEMGVAYVRDVIRDVLSDNALKADAAHPNAAGYRKVAEAVAEALRTSGAI